MAKNILLFQTLSQFTDKRDNDYIEPWVSLTVENGKIDLNKSEREKLLGTPLTFEITGNGNIIWDGYPYRTIEYKKNDGEWTSVTPASLSPVQIPVVAGDVVQFRGNNTPGISEGDSTKFYASTAQFKAKGNIMSLANSTNFSELTTITSGYAFSGLFSQCTGLTDASKLLLPATTLANNCYHGMFYGCTSLATAPELPATSVAAECYRSMFADCTSLATAPALPATSLQYCIMCYSHMFADCTSLTAAPELPATILADACYNGMFYGCTSLVSAPSILPATTLASECYGGAGMVGSYYGMFQGCTNLTTAPELPATTLVRYCYFNMFKDCTNLASVKCLATSFGTGAGNATSYWLSGVSASGTFTKAASMADWSTGESGIPSGWDIVNE